MSGAGLRGRPSRQHWPIRIGLASILAVGAGLRFWNIAAGLPYRVGVDEPVIAERAIAIMRSGSFNPHFFDYPGLYLYMQVLIGSVRFLTGAMDGLWRSLDDFRPEHMFLWTRLVNAAFGTITLLIVYRAGLRWGRGAALIAAAMLAVWPNHIRESHFALTDVPLTMWTTLVLMLSLRAYETGRMVWFLSAGASVGLAAATRYGGAVALVMPLLAAVGCDRPSAVKSGRAFAAAGAAATVFSIGAPYTLLDLPGFLNGFGSMAMSYRPRSFQSGAGLYLHALWQEAGWPAFITLIFGVVLAVIHAIRDRQLTKWSLVLVFPLLYFHLIATKHLIFARYMLPILPFVCLVSAGVVADAAAWVSSLDRPRAIRVAVVAAMLVLIGEHMVRAGTQWSKSYGMTTTQDMAYAQIRQFIPGHSIVAVEHAVLRLPDTAYREVDVHRLTERSLEEYVSSGVSFFVASSDAFGQAYERPDQHSATYAAYRRLLDGAAECLPTVTRTRKVRGPDIRICRLRTP